MFRDIYPKKGLYRGIWGFRWDYMGFKDIYLNNGESTGKEKGNEMDTGACIDM